MTYSETQEREGGKTARGVLQRYSTTELERMFREYGEIRKAAALAKEITQSRTAHSISTTRDLTEVARRVLGTSNKSYARVFQALRIEVNNEIEALEKGIQGAWSILEEGGVLAVVSFHSLEDRLVKEFFKKKENGEEGKRITRKPIRPTPEETLSNPRARSARLRAARKQTNNYPVSS
jgi:16S rRNA (cytosine1402-N4)-methyltransferase